MVLFYTYFFVFLLWMFYEETYIAGLYGIGIIDFQYYFLFSVFIIPFQIVTDVFFMNMKEWYVRVPLHDYLDYLRFRFFARKARWKGYEGFRNPALAKSL